MCIYILEVFSLHTLSQELVQNTDFGVPAPETKTSGSGAGIWEEKGAEIYVFNKHPGVSDPGGLEKNSTTENAVSIRAVCQASTPLAIWHFLNNP